VRFASKTLPALLLLLLAAGAAFSQDAEQPAQPTQPELASLQANWWSFFDGDKSTVEPRVTSFLEDAAENIQELDLQNQAAATAILDAARDNFSAYVALLDESEPAPQELPPPAVSYTLDELLALGKAARKAKARAAEERQEVERERRILEGASRRRDLAFKDYVAVQAGDQRILSGLRLVQTRVAQAIATRRVELLTSSARHAAEFADATAVRAALAVDNLAETADKEALQQLIAREAANEAAVDSAREQLRAAEVDAASLDLSADESRSQQELLQQKRVDAEVKLALAETALGLTQARRWWTELQQDAVPSLSLLEERSLGWSELLRRIEQDRKAWLSSSQDELLAVQTMSRDGLSRSIRRLLDQRLGTAQDTLNRISELDAATADLTLLSQAVDNAAAQYSGALQSWWSGFTRQVKTMYLRVAALSDATLFSVGETPVTGGDIVRVLIILGIAFLLSRGVRHAIRRFSQSESSGTQASLYTVGRLTHYSIIIIAGFIALSSIGLDFSNLALVAGALSVGIGFGLQSIVSNFVSGLIILFEHTLRVGDYIELDTGLTGTVKAINVRSTLINTNDNIDIVVPNSEFVTTRLTNWTLGERILRVRIPFGVAYGSDKELVRKAALEAAAEVQYTLQHMKGREPDIWLVEFGDNSLNFLLLVWVNRQGARRPTRTKAAYLWALETKLKEYGIEIPFPQRDLHLKSGWQTMSEPPAPEPEDDDAQEDRPANG
jgi:small-conductance mechanosensitive channel